MRAIRRFTVRVTLPQPLAPLHDLMLNLRWSWHPPTVELFESIDPAGWAASGGDPVAMLSSMRPGSSPRSPPTRTSCAAWTRPWPTCAGYTGEPRWYQSGGAGRPRASLPKAIAYFSPEYGITAVLPQYSGGLGILAGDHLKSASDLGVPDHRRRPALPARVLHPVAVGRRLAGRALPGRRPQRPAADPAARPRRRPGEDQRDPSPSGKLLTAQVWLAQVGRVPLLMLDSYVEENEPALHEVTDRLYGGGSEHRLRQELLLGIGGVRAVRAFCAITGHPEPEVFHTNEGHAGFLGLERIREYVAAGLSFDEALELSRAGTVFTTHTPVPAGIDRFPRELIERYFTADAAGGGAAGRPGARARRGDLPGRRPAHVQHGRHGHAPRAAGQRRLRAARRGQPGDVRGPVAGLRHRRGADRLDHQRRARAHLGRARGLRPRRLAAPPRPTPRGCGRSAASSAPGWSPRPGAGCASPGSSGARPAPS